MLFNNLLKNLTNNLFIQEELYAKLRKNIFRNREKRLARASNILNEN